MIWPQSYSIQNKKTHRSGYYFFIIDFKILNLLQLNTTKIANDVPTKLATTSKISALLVVVIKFCNISIVIPKANERTTENIKGFDIESYCNCLAKNKNQTNVNTK